MEQADQAETEPRKSTGRLLLDAVQQASDLATKQFALLKAELDEISRTARILCSSFGGGAVFLFCGAFLLLVAAVKFLAWLTGSEVLGAVIVATPFIIIAAGLGYWGLSKMHSVGRRHEMAK
ncbi:phage holin family protein [Methylobacterium nodulans]|uniref:Phage holin family protein n=1 Tax=Methylobacterium nodulans (strain LMG 21967 / CNCM I-2342 / ORS 2060) TaxID=460265 RepID=B8IPP3_METNO|nr:phage holin family protein [Methylobacterium nodulans]ACL62335.1 protein of unknown function DUF1469 [Methylobacterium nodulans ORS 2060]